MADNNLQIDDLQIDIVVNAEKAEEGIRQIATAIRNAGQTASVLKEITQRLREMGDASAKSQIKVEKLSDAIDNVGSSAEGAGDEVEDTDDKIGNLGRTSLATTSKLGQLFASFKRIATYRAMRSVIRSITQALSEGIENLKAWDLLIQNTSYANTTMNTLKATTTQLANTFAALAMPIIQIAVPAIQFLANVVMKVVNFFNQVIRAFQGFGTYIKATALSIEDMNNSLQKASGTAKELKRVLFGFDELNVLPSPDTGSAGGGIGALWNFADMFEETDIDEESIAGKIGEQLAAVKTFLEPYFADIWSGFGMQASGIGKIAAGLLKGDFDLAWEGANEAWDGFVFVIDAIKRLKDDVEVKFQPVISAISGAFETAYDYAKVYFFDPIGIAIDAFLKTLKLGVEFILNPFKWNQEGVDQLKSDIKQVWVDAFEQTTKSRDEFIIKRTKKAFNTARTQAGKETPIPMPSQYTIPTNGKKTWKYARAEMKTFGAVSMETKLKNIANAQSTKRDAQSAVNKLSQLMLKIKT